MNKTFAFSCFILPFLTGAALPPQTQNPARAGNDACITCHEDIQARIDKTVHLTALAGCEDCHGPGAKHADEPGPDNIITFRDTPPAKITAACAQCHSTFSSTHTSHFRNRRSCLDCHDLWHSEKTVKAASIPAPGLLKGTREELCTPCHNRVQSDFQRPYRHPAARLENRCLSCHNPHQSKKEIQQREVDRKCASCHPDYAGPYAFVHAGTKARGCMGCHVPHGSANANLLTRSTPRFLCLSCHTVLPASHRQNNPQYRSCTACHNQIHGSNFNPRFLD